MAGYNPASVTTANLLQASQVTHYSKNFIANLKAETPFLRCATTKELPEHSGVNYAVFEYTAYGENLIQAPEGVVGQGLPVSVLTTSYTIGEYADYANFSSRSLATAIDNAVENVGKELAYRLGRTLSLLVRNTADGAILVDSSVRMRLAATSTSVFTVLSIFAIRSAVQSLSGRSVLPFNAGNRRFRGVVHPFAWGDVINDTANNSTVDILKNTPQGMDRLDNLPSTDLGMMFELPGTGVEFYQSNLVTQIPNYDPGAGAISGLTALRTYIFGSDAVFRINLGYRGNTSYGDGNYRNIKSYTMQNADPSVADPAGMIPGWTSYRVMFTTGLPPDTTGRLRVIDAGTAIS